MSTKKKKTSKKKKKKTSTKSTKNTTSTQMQLKQELTKGLTELAEVTITIPLSKVTRNIHTRMFIQTQLSLPELQNMKQIGQIFKANAYYYSDKYVKNVWFVKKTKVTVTPTDESMTLTLTPFNDSYESEANTLSGLTEQKSTTSSTSTTSTVNLEGDDFLKDTVKKAIGSKTDKVQMAKAIHEYYKSNHVYKLYPTSVKDEYNKGFKTLWNQKSHSCGPGAATLYYMLKCIGLHPMIMNGHNHYWIQVEIDDQTYYCDQAGQEGKHNTRKMGTSTGDSTVWGGATGGSIVMRG